MTSKNCRGQVVGVHAGRISKRTEGAEQIMSVSLAPIVLGNTPPTGEEDDWEKVGFMGQVPVLVVGGCKAGDFLVPSGDDDGVAVAVAPRDLRVHHMRLVLGRAFEDSENDRVDLVNTLIGVKTNEWATLFEHQAEQLADAESRLDDQGETIDALLARMESLEAQLAQR